MSAVKDVFVYLQIKGQKNSRHVSGLFNRQVQKIETSGERKSFFSLNPLLLVTVREVSGLKA